MFEVFNLVVALFSLVVILAASYYFYKQTQRPHLIYDVRLTFEFPVRGKKRKVGAYLTEFGRGLDYESIRDGQIGGAIAVIGDNIKDAYEKFDKAFERDSS